VISESDRAVAQSAQAGQVQQSPNPPNSDHPQNLCIATPDDILNSPQSRTLLNWL